ncbi:MAG: MGMT family protein, partial [Syntrophobacteraceae bacterium]
MSGGFELDFVYFETRLGWILVVTTEAGVSMVEFLGPAKPSSEKIESIIRKENPEAIPRGAIESSLAVKVMKHIVNYLQKRTPLPDIPIDVRKGTDFERGVWRAISAIPFGETRSYKQVAAAVGRP